jgi:hypothetical protein
MRKEHDNARERLTCRADFPSSLEPLLWPVVRDDDWCGSWDSREERQEVLDSIAKRITANPDPVFLSCFSVEDPKPIIPSVLIDEQVQAYMRGNATYEEAYPELKTPKPKRGKSV